MSKKTALGAQSAEEKYSDIIGLPHHRSAKRPPMDRIDRAAQFAPFAALTGFDAQIDEAARYTGSRMDLDESQQAVINDVVSRCAGKNVALVYFLPDSR